MLLHSRQLLALAALFPLLAGMVLAQDHVVPLSDLRRDVNGAASERAKNLADIDRVLATPAVRDELSRVQIKGDQVQAAMSRLDDRELGRLAERARAADMDVQAGGKGEVLFIAGLVLVIFLIVTLTQVL